MANNKNQHFVPKSHFKPFSINREGRAIHLFNLDNMRIIFNASVKKQCSQDYFYGRNQKLEEAIQSVERGYAKCVSSLHEPDASIDEFHQVALRRFAYLQHLRTEAAARRSAEMTFAVSSIGGASFQHPPMKDAIRDSVIIAMQIFAETMESVDDLKVRIVRNTTTTPFITSDDPAIIANRWHQSRRYAKHSGFGIYNAGIILFLPLSPTLLAILFDGDVYRAEHSSGWIDLSNPLDVDACNHQQVLNCAANLYFGDLDSKDYVKSIAHNDKKFRPTEPFELNTAIRDYSTDTHTRYAVIPKQDIPDDGDILVHVKSVRPVPQKWPSFLKLRNRRYVFTNDTAEGYRRRMTAVPSSFDSPTWRKIRV
ncbi:DUF4238 domain-containing protein [Rhizobiales bacterium]|uniref:DUF4238 domain-containing protein n=1 Tax=Hongsoonwoonella zoysiae TaxID=2821844 RepID=UPI00155FE379|nr:DUF4238 domain-containing protein [Hongsoonwoonella zoysiae]NRG16114.1 DUF4238 domain-containing protein [Hongsoonwoonella zoysiae]